LVILGPPRKHIFRSMAMLFFAVFYRRVTPLKSLPSLEHGVGASPLSVNKGVYTR
jgi:hypothetical protein